MSKNEKSRKTTSARHFKPTAFRLLTRLKKCNEEAAASAWVIGDVVNKLKAEGVSVQEQATFIKASRQRLSELRQTALAFPVEQRPKGIDFHFCTVAMRSARRLGLSAHEVVDELVDRGIDSSRQATRYLADKLRENDVNRSRDASLRQLRKTGIWNRAHAHKFQNVLPKVDGQSIKLVIADPPYADYGMYADGRHNTVSAALRSCDNLSDEAARRQHLELFELTATGMVSGGCLIIFRPGGLGDPPWLMQAAIDHGWECRHALAWRRGPVKLGNGRSPYTSGTERILIFARQKEELLNHDGSSSADILEVKLPRKSYACADEHLFGKPVELMQRLILKHTHPGETVVEPFGGSGPVSRAAAILNRRWIYCESNQSNFDLGSRLIAEQIESSARNVG